MFELLQNEFLPDWFEYPAELLELLTNDEVDFGPWQLLQGKWLNIRHEGLKQRYPNLHLIPFARRLDSDDVACFDVSQKSSSPRIKIIHDFASVGWEEREELDDFKVWLVEAKEEAADWD